MQTMTVTLDLHEQILDEFIADVKRIEDDVRGFVLFGTAGRGDVIPGESDLMDAYVFLRHEVFADKARFMRAVDVMAAAHARYVESSPFPTHAYFYWDERDPVPGHFIREMTTFSRIILGEDIRPNIYTTEPSRDAGRGCFFEIRRMGAPLMVLLNKKDLTEKECHAIYNGLLVIVKHVPMSACMALNIWAGLPESIDVLRKTLPDLDSDVLDKINELRYEPDRHTDAERLRALMREAMIFVEKLNDRLVAELNKGTRPQVLFS
jgi:hypothetical protein